MAALAANQNMITISLCMIVKNEEDILARCLNSIKAAADEIIIVDTGSSDNTIELSKSFTEKVYEFEWINDFSAARNYAFSKATSDYIMWLDADDVITYENLQKLLELKNNLNTDVDVVMMKYNTAFDENKKPTFSYYRERLLKREKNFLWKEPVHECVDIFGNIIKLPIEVNHKKEKHGISTRNLDIYNSLLKSGQKLSPRGNFYYAKELYETGNYAKASAEFENYLALKEGWTEDKITACYQLSFCYENLGQEENMSKTLFRSFLYAAPRAEIICKIAKSFFNKGMYQEAIFWYKLALVIEIPDTTGFVHSDFYSYIPAIELCVCYDKMGDKKEALKYHKLSKQIKPTAPAVLYNEEYFNTEK